MKTAFSVIFHRYLLFSMLSLILSFSCAHQVPPSGGPEDKTGPTILATIPASGAVNVKQDSRISISFSKWIAKPAALKSISILPPLEKGSAIKVNGRHLEIAPVKPFAEATTYHVVITTGLIDLHNNPIASSFTLVFSTGSTLDSGKITGCVFDAAKRTMEPTVALFGAPHGAADTQFLRNPDYLTQGDSSGYFSIENVRPGAYRLIAFVDKNNDKRLEPAVEETYSPLHSVISVSKQTEAVMLYPIESDTATPRLKSVKPVSSKELMCTWSGTLDSLHGCSEPLWSLASGKNQKGLAVSQTFWFDNRSRCALLIPDSLSMAQYHLIVTYRKNRQTSSNIISDTIPFNGTNNRDTVRPALQSCSPIGVTGLLPEIRLLFTKPVILTSRLFLVDSLRDSVALNALQQCSDTAVLSPARRLHPGSRYHLLVLKNSGKDLAGNMLKARDTSDTVARPEFATIDPDSLAISVKGCAPCLAPDAKRKWQFLPFAGTASPLICADKNNCFNFDSIPAGKGFVAYFSDANNNNKPDKGVLEPFTPPEPYIILPDTVEARARWEIEGITLTTACDRCQPHKSVTPGVEKKK